MAEYISLQEASRLCSYSQEYLSLRARQGKLRALKLGRNWVCTREWLEEYIAKSESHKKRESQACLVDPPRNLPIYAPEAEIWEDGTPEDVERQKTFQRKFQFAFAVALVAALSLASMFQGHEQVFMVAKKVSAEAVLFTASLQEAAQETGFALGSEIQTWPAASVGEVAKDYFSWLGEQFRNIIKGY